MCVTLVWLTTSARYPSCPTGSSRAGPDASVLLFLCQWISYSCIWAYISVYPVKHVSAQGLSILWLVVWKRGFVSVFGCRTLGPQFMTFVIFSHRSDVASYSQIVFDTWRFRVWKWSFFQSVCSVATFFETFFMVWKRFWACWVYVGLALPFKNLR